ncbi:MAG: TIGR02453 family protein [Granulosicoccus sp.]
MFSVDTFKFLNELASNNNREWFDRNRQRYEDEVREPAFDYIRSMEKPIADISPHFIVAAKKTGGSLMRVIRDLRFSKDKTPYKTNIGIQFRHAAGKDVHAPGFYLHIEPSEMFLAAGIWRPDNPTLNKVRTLIDEYPDEWDKIKRNLTSKKNDFEFHGESLKKAPKGFTGNHMLLDDLRRKHYLAVKQIDKKVILGKSATKNTAALFEKAVPLVKFICEANDLDF